MEERYLIIADDFTGANDTGVQLRRRGFPTEVLFCGKPMGADRSIVIDTESRTVHPDHAYEIVSHALEDVDFGSFRYVIKKVDSTMRGNIAAEIKACLLYTSAVLTVRKCGSLWKNGDSRK